ncbi:hypothetical protein MMC07_002193 [Pseudocyphellaria aurata]|nr:hypothetical protein [Pseudocyphellaria aurata]
MRAHLLDLLLDVNESNYVPFHLRYDLRSLTPDVTDVPALEPDRSQSPDLIASYPSR